MRWTRAVEGAGSIARVWRAEGFAAVRDRVWDRARDATTRARCVRGGRDPWPAASILNVIGVPMTTAFGGVPLQLRARLRHESMARPVALLSREPGALPSSARSSSGLSSSERAAGGWRLEWWSGGRPRRAMTFPAGDWDGDPLSDDPAWLHAVRTCARLVNARAIHIENAAGLSLVSLSTLMGVGAPLDGFDGARVPVVLSVHDLSLFSRHPHAPSHSHTPQHPLGSRLAYGSRDPHGPHPPRGPQHPHGPQAHADGTASLVDDRQRFEHALHHALGTGILRAAAFTIYPSRFMRHRIEALPHHPAHVVAPGIEPPERALRSARRHDQIALLGGGQEHKGGARLAQIAAALAARGMQVTSYGGYGHEHLLQMRGIAGVRVRGYYRAGTLPELLARQGASVALILPAVPESFSLVLSEAWASGVPVIAPASGAFTERLRAPDAPALARVKGAEAARAPGGPRSFTSRSQADRAPGGEVHGGLQAAAQVPAQGVSDEDAVRAGGLLVSVDASDEEILAAVDRVRGMALATLADGLPAPPTAAQSAERHLALYRDAGFMADPAGA